MQVPWGYTRARDGSFHGTFRGEGERPAARRSPELEASWALFGMPALALVITAQLKRAPPDGGNAPFLLFVWAVVLAGMVQLWWSRRRALEGSEWSPRHSCAFTLEAGGVRQEVSGEERFEPFDPSKLRVGSVTPGHCLLYDARPLGPRRATPAEAARDRAFVLAHFGCEDLAPKPLALHPRGGELRCAYCKAAIGAAPLCCGACGAAVHSECGEQQPTCTTLGCRGHFLTPLTRIRVES